MTASVAAVPLGPCPPTDSWLRRAGVLVEEQGASIAAHLAVCPTCLQLHGELQELRASLGRLGAGAQEPASGWQRAVFARIEKKRKPGWLRYAATLGPLAAAAGIALVLLTRGPAPPTGDTVPVLGMRFQQGAAAVRGRGEVAAGDHMILRAEGVRAAIAELRVYRDDAGLVFRCPVGGNGAARPGKPGETCTRDGGHVEARFVLPAVGRYRVLIISADAPLPALTGSFDRDIGALAATAGVSYQLGDTVDVW